MSRALRIIAWLDSEPGIYCVTMAIIGLCLVGLKLGGWK